MTREELETLKCIQFYDKSVAAAVALISRLPTFADGAPMVTPCDVWIVPGNWSWMSDVEGGREPEQVKIWNYNADRHGGHYCLTFAECGTADDRDFGFGPVYQTEQAARESIK
jgi:hypothetical protein